MTAENQPETASTEHTANPGFALGQLAAALQASQHHADPEVRERAAGKVQRWMDVLTGMLSGGLRIGERTPVADVPAWATPEVVYGGFTTGKLRAGGPLRAHEQALLARLGDDRSGKPRARLNAWYLTEDGFAELRDMLATGHYRVEAPEEAALLTVAWLVERGETDAAREVLDEIAPHFPTLRFYPVPAAQPLDQTASVHLQTVREATRELSRLGDPGPVVEQREAVLVWAPLMDRAISLFLETVAGDVPELAKDEHGELIRGEDGTHGVRGGWPCQRYPEGWAERARALLDDYARLRATHAVSARPDRPRESFATLRRYLERCATDPASLSGWDVGVVRGVLAGAVTRRGVPGSERAAAFARGQRAGALAPTRSELSRVVVGRLAAFDPEGGVESLDGLLAPVAAEEAGAHGVRPGASVARLRPRLRRVQSAPVETLVERGVIVSGEVLARAVSPTVASVLASGIADEALRRLYVAVYRAFRLRRSLMLLNLESQVRLGELPWVRAIQAQRGVDAAQGSRQALERIAALAITSWPQQIIPNKLLQEMRALADECGLQLPLVDELAADIFMGAFTPKFLHAAKIAGEMLQGTLYERYYAIDYTAVRAIDDVQPSEHRGARTSAAFAELCRARAEPGTGGGSWVAHNGAVIEQSQILTTHNLAVLFTLPGVADAVRPKLDELARGCFDWTCWRLQQTGDGWGTRLRIVKNAAYAWRQMIFFLSLLPADEARAFLTWAHGHLNEQPPAFRDRFRPALEGLSRAAKGGDAADGGQARRFLGWSPGGAHWLLVN